MFNDKKFAIYSIRTYRLVPRPLLADIEKPDVDCQNQHLANRLLIKALILASARFSMKIVVIFKLSTIDLPGKPYQLALKCDLELHSINFARWLPIRV